MGERRESKKRETRQRISDVATGLFFVRGFEAVTLDEIALAAKVSKGTVLNYFARKEELMLDREDDLRLVPLAQAISDRPKDQSPVDALRARFKALNDEQSPLAHLERESVHWWRIIAESPSLKARLRELADEATDVLAKALGGPRPDGLARLRAGLIVLTVRTAREEAIRQLERGVSAKKANAALLDLMERGLSAVEGLGPSSGAGPN